MKIVATNIIASRPTRMPTAHAKITEILNTNIVAIRPTEPRPTVMAPARAKKKKRENNHVNSGHKHHCQSTARTPTDWNAARSCQKPKTQMQVIIFFPKKQMSYYPPLPLLPEICLFYTGKL